MITGAVAHVLRNKLSLQKKRTSKQTAAFSPIFPFKSFLSSVTWVIFLLLGSLDETASSVQDSDHLHCHCAICHLAG